MASWWFRKSSAVEVTILGMVGERLVRYNKTVQLRGSATVRTALRIAGAGAGVDLLAALAAGAEPALLLDGRRLLVPEELDTPVVDGAHLSWLSPMAGG